MVVAAPASFSGNNALALDSWVLANQASLQASLDAPPSVNPDTEPPLWRGQASENEASPPRSTQKVIPFDQIPRPGLRVPPAAQFRSQQSSQPQAPASQVQAPASQPLMATPQLAPPQVTPPAARPAPPQQRRKSQGAASGQASLDFTATTAPHPKTLTNGVPASNYCQRPVATVAHRFFAAVIDTAMILLGFFLFVAGAQLAGMAVGAPEILGSGTPFLIMLGSFLFGVTAFYGVIWMFAGRETAGMRVAGLELITFDNSPLDPTTRLIRIATTWLSIGSAGLGVIWAIADEEKLTWQDHISKSFPTFREGDNTLVKQHR